MISEEKEELFYQLEDHENDDSPINFAAYDEDEAEENPIEEQEIKKGAGNAFLMLMRILFEPVEGWKRLRRSKVSVDAIQSRCFYPILAILAISEFADFFYSVNVSLAQVITGAVISFVAFFFGYFCVQMMVMWILPSRMGERYDSLYGKQYTLMALSSLALFSIFIKLFPMIWPILIFLPLWTLYLMYKGVKFFHFEAKEEMRFYLTTAVCVIAVPMIIDWGLTEVMPY